MLVRDFLVALPGLVSPLMAPRAAEATDFTARPAQITAQASFDVFGLNRTDSSTSTLLDLYKANNVSTEAPKIAQLIVGDDGGNNGDPGNGGGDGEPGDPGDGPGTGEPGGPIDGGEDPTPIDFGGLPLGTEQVVAEAGRVTHIAPSADTKIADVSIVTQSSYGHVSVNPDKSISLVLSEDPTRTEPVSFTYDVSYLDGRTETVTTSVEVTPSQQAAGWGQGEFYMLEEDKNDGLVIEHGENHRKFYLTMGDHGLTAADIAAREGLEVSKITPGWLMKHPEYGGSEGMALKADLGMKLWYEQTHSKNDQASSHWLLFERGYDYGETGRLIMPQASGESELNPLYIGAYGEGADPIIRSKIQIYQRDSDHVVIQGIDAPSMMVLQGSNILLDKMSFTKDMLNIQNVDNFTLRNSDLVDIYRDDPDPRVDYWHPSLNRTGGVFIAESEGILLERNFLDHNGWSEGYDYNLSAKYPQPPSYFSHNLYVANNNLDLTVRDNIIMRGASFGAQVRSGGVIENNIFLDNNAAVSSLGGDYMNAGPIGNNTLYLDNLVTSAGHKRVAEKEGALSMGLDAHGKGSLIGNIVAHLADPNNQAEINEKTVQHFGLKITDPASFNDTIVYNWHTTQKGAEHNPDINIEGLDTAVLDQTTIQNFTAKLLNKENASIDDLANHLRAQASGKLDHVVDADLINAYFREGFGLSTTLRAAETTLRFSPDDRGDGMRWDNRLNWSTTDLPGTQDGDSVDLGGNRVLFGAQTVTVDDFIFGDFGQLKATSGRLNITGKVSVAETGALLQVDNAGQVWLAGYRDDDLLKIDLQGGRFANIGAFAGPVTMTVGDNAQALLATAGCSFDLRQGSSLTIDGTRTKTGFDGATGQTAILRMHDGATINMVAGADGLGQIREFYSGAFGDKSSVTSGIRLDGTLSIDLSNWTATSKAQQWKILDADQLIGQFDDFKLTGLANDRDALLRVNYVSDDVMLVISAAGTGTGRVRMSESGEANFINYTTDDALKSLWDGLHQPAPELSDLPL